MGGEVFGKPLFAELPDPCKFRGFKESIAFGKGMFIHGRGFSLSRSMPVYPAAILLNNRLPPNSLFAGADADRKAFSSLGPSSPEHVSAARSFHPLEEAVRAQPFFVAWLICPFHVRPFPVNVDLSSCRKIS